MIEKPKKYSIKSRMIQNSGQKGERGSVGPFGEVGEAGETGK